MSKERKKLVLLDAHAIIHRAYHALPGFTSPSGEPTGALYGLTLMLLSIIDTLQPDYIAACYDLPGKTFRHEAYKEYKGGRKEIEPELLLQLQSSRELCEKFAIPIYDAPGFEADDMLGTIVDQMKGKGFDIVIASGDMDTLQLVDGKDVQVYTLRKGIKDTILYDEKAVVERFGFDPELLVDYKGLRGDPSDNIKGIKGIGDKTATTLITLFGSLDAIYVALEKDPETLIAAGIKKRIVGLLQEGKEDALFSRILATIRRDAPIIYLQPDHAWTDDIDAPVLVEYLGGLGFRTLIERVRKLFGEEAVQATLFMDHESLDEAEVYRTGIALWLLSSETTSPTLDDILQYTGERSFAKAQARIFIELDERDLKKVYEDIELPIIPLIKKMEDRGILLDVDHFAKLSTKLHAKLEVLEAGIFKAAGREFNIRSPKQLGEILFDELDLSVKGLKKTATGARSTRESELRKLIDEHPIIDLLLQYREFHKIVSTYVDPLPKMVDEKSRLHTKLLQAGTSTGRFASANPNLQNIPTRSDLGAEIREGFVATPGFIFLSCDYSQIELRITAIMSQDEYMLEVFSSGGDIHAAVAAKVFGVTVDKVTKDMRRQAKVINFGIIYGMGVNALRENLGTSREEAQQFYNQYFEQFPTIKAYLDSIKTSAVELGYTQTMFGRRRYFPALQSKLPHVRAQAERMAVNAPIQGTATADIIKLALTRVAAVISERGWEKSVFPLLQIHDELMFEVAEDIINEVAPVIKEAMEHATENSPFAYKAPIPLSVDANMGKTWGELKD